VIVDVRGPPVDLRRRRSTRLHPFAAQLEPPIGTAHTSQSNDRARRQRRGRSCKRAGGSLPIGTVHARFQLTRQTPFITSGEIARASIQDIDTAIPVNAPGQSRRAVEQLPQTERAILAGAHPALGRLALLRHRESRMQKRTFKWACRIHCWFRIRVSLPKPPRRMREERRRMLAGRPTPTQCELPQRGLLLCTMSKCRLVPGSNRRIDA
jgi:hypothetical protein